MYTDNLSYHLMFFSPSFQLSVFYYVFQTQMWLNERKRISQRPSSPPYPFHPGLLHMKEAAQREWTAGGVCAMRGPQTQTQHNTHSSAGHRSWAGMWPASDFNARQEPDC